MNCRFVRHLLVASALLLASGGYAAAQTTGTITGTVTISGTEAPIPGVVIQVLNASGGRVGSSLTNQSGRFLVTNIPAGSYTVTASMTGYQAGRLDGVQVTAGQAASANLSLEARAIDLDPVVVSASRRQERALDAPARVEVVSPQLIEERPAVQPVDHLRSISGVDVVQQGLQSTNVVARGFNNIFSGALLALTDHRMAAIPSLRVNALYMVPSTNEDIERMEVVLGPGSALYGPNTANGVLHMFTRSPLTYQGTTATVTGGDRSVLHTTFRTAHLVGEDFGFKVSGQYFRGDEWEFTDPIEEQARVANPGTRIGVRDFDTQRWAVDGRFDWRVTPDATAIFSAGRSSTGRGVELTGLGAAQVRDWSYDYVQGRFNWNRLFVQAYANLSSAGDTYLLRDGADIVDDSRQYVAQIQHGFQPFNWQNFTYGFDWIRTMPETGGTIHGRFEDEDEFTEAGVFLQSETALNPQFDLVLAGRLDRHSVIDDIVFSPRAALVFKPVENQTFRASYNRAYSNPGSIQLFLDLNAGPAGAAGPFGYNVRAQGTGRSGFTFRQADGSYVMKSPFNSDPTALQTINTANLWQMQVQGIAGALIAQGQMTPAQAQQFVQYMLSQTPSAAQVGFIANSPITGLGAFVGPEDVPGIRESNTTSYEIGYKGILGGRVLLAADVWYSQRDNFISPLTFQNSFVLLDPTQAGAYATPRIQAFFEAAGMPPAQAAATAQAVAGGMVQIPGGVVSSPDVQGGPNLLVTYKNFGNIDLWGTDLAATALLGDWTLGLSTSLVNEDHFRTEGEIIALNAPKAKVNVSLGYRDEPMGFNGELRVRHQGAFPVNSGVYVGLNCIESSNPDPCVESATLADLTMGYRIPRVAGASLQLTVQNIFDSNYQSFVGVPEIGRMALLRLRYDF
jgi:outer membrane receptor for ferrienterochelin and colicins